MYDLCLMGLIGPTYLAVHGYIDADEYLDACGEPRRRWGKDVAGSRNDRRTSRYRRKRVRDSATASTP
jgi:hypothetical protein